MFGLFYFGAFDAEDENVRKTIRAIENKLWVKTDVGGVARFERDDYMQTSADFENVAGNPWFICTLWLAEYRIAVAKDKKDLKGAVEILEWAAERALPSGVLAEQIHPETGEPVSVSPLTWSHSTFVAAVNNYLLKNSMIEVTD
jgi:GH15 family glucan-1,4-alpha-glucosidase